jgi:hypothetical protein
MSTQEVPMRRKSLLPTVLVTLVLWAALLFSLGIVTRAYPQSGGFITNGRTETNPNGRYVTMYNATGVEILDGTLVMVDTVAATTGPQIPLGKGFKTWTGASTDRVDLVIGILIGDCPGYDQGRVLVEGFHNNALMDATGLTGLTRLRPSLTTAGALTSWALADSVNSYKPRVGIFQRYKDGTTLRGYVRVNFPGPGSK